MNKQLNFYLTGSFNPVEIDQSNASKLDLHLSQRLNLLQNHLKIPLSLLRGKKVLEFGPCGGENALLLAMNGADIYFVEPNVEMHKIIQSNFENKGLQSSLKFIYNELIENFKSDESFDLVIAEGFLHALKDRVDVINKIKSFSNSTISITYSCPYGYFFESLKRGIFKFLLLELGKNKLEIATLLFKEDFDKLNTARTFTSWIEDILLNPVTDSKSLDLFDELITKIEGDGFIYYSSSPSWDTRSLSKWYKKVDTTSIIDEWKKNLEFFITGKSNSLGLSLDELKVVPEMTRLFLDYSSYDKSFPVEEIQALIKNKSNPFFNEVSKMIEYIKLKDSNGVINFYSESLMLRSWGMPHHYLVMCKTI